MKNLFIYWVILCCGVPVFAASMFDDSGNYSGNWKQMTRVNTSTYSKKYDSSAYSGSNWYRSNQQQQAINRGKQFSVGNYTESSATSFRYNTLDYTRVRKVKGGYGDYSARCHDIGAVSFCR